MNTDVDVTQRRLEDASSDELRAQINKTRDEMDATLDELGARVRRIRRTARLLRGPIVIALSIVGFLVIRLIRASRR
jgi:hypothetical protein